MITEPEWVKVVFTDECVYEYWDTGKDNPICPACGKPYTPCSCPSASHDDKFHYKIVKGVLFAKKKVELK